jgi:hypothetical protein
MLSEFPANNCKFDADKNNTNQSGQFDFAGVIGKLSVRPNGVVWSDAVVKVIRNGADEKLD